MTEQELTNILQKTSDEVFIKVIRKNKNRIERIKKEEKEAAIDAKFIKKGKQCPDCKSFKVVKKWS